MSFEDDLLSDGGKWWEFLDETYQVKEMPAATHASTDLLDWSTKFKLQERHGPVGFDFYERCAQCTQPLPADVTFCFHCGGEPNRSGGFTPFAVMIKEIEDDTALEEGATLIAATGQFSAREARSILRQLPAAFMVNAPKKQVVAFCGRLSDIGVYSRAYPADATPINWAREALESVFRDATKMLVGFVVLFGLLAGGWFSSGWLWTLLPFAIFFGLYFELNAYKQRFQIDPIIGLNHASGFEGDRAEHARYFLRTIRHKGIRRKLTVCLMEYYALSQTIRGHRHSYGAVLENASNDLHDLLESVFGLCEFVVKIESVPDLLLVQQKLQSIDQKLSVTENETLRMERAVVMDQMKTSQKASGMLSDVEGRLNKMNVSLESLRTKISRFQNDADRVREDAELMETILSSLDDELDVFAQTYEAVEVHR